MRVFAVPAGSLGDALLVYAEQAGVSIATGDPRLRGLRSAGLRGRYDVGEALARLLAGSGLTFAFTNADTVELRSVPRPAVRRRPQPVSAPPPPAVGQEIVVMATKQGATLADYPASVSTVALGQSDTARGGGEGTAYVLSRLPGLASTNLGPGRNKLFIRGVADSSFNGGSQATISQYLGEARLIYSAPDPDLLLYDMERVEVLEGPQGTLYGAGTLGGVIRLMPRAPELDDISLSVSSGVRFTRDGAPGFDAAAAANVPLVADTLAGRVVGYALQEGGYINDVLRRRSNVNRNRITGVRATVRWRPRQDWTVDLGLVAQDVASRDGQYADTDIGRLSRASAIAQPFDNDYRLATLTLSHDAGPVQLVSSTSYTHHVIRSVFDATTTPGVTQPRAYREDEAIDLVAHETRASGALGSGGRWITGAALLFNHDRATRMLGAVDDPQVLASVANSTLDTALFGEATLPLTTSLSLTGGGRLSYVRQTSEFAGGVRDAGSEPRRKQFRALPSAALAWKRSGWLAYARYQEGYRPGALQISGAPDSVTAVRFERDHIGTLELGMRFGTMPGARLSGSLAASSASWDDIQADLVDENGFPLTANIGSGRVRNLSATLAWRAAPAMTVEASGFIASSDLSKPAPGYGAARDRDLPNIANEGWRIAARYEHDLAAHLSLDAGVRYVGHSKLAVRPPFNLDQGGYYDVSLGGRLALGRLGLSLDVGNLLDARANTFAFGNPFSLAHGTQSTPLRPRSVRLGVDASF